MSRARRAMAVGVVAWTAAAMSLPVRIDAAAFDITTIAGTGAIGNSGDGGPATSARLYLPSGLAFDTAGNLFVSVYGSHVVRRIAPDGIITTIAGTGSAGAAGDGGPATAAQLNAPADLVFNAAGNLYVADHGGHRVRKITPGGIITTVAGTGTAGFSGDGGAASSAMLSGPVGLDVDSSGALYIADMANHRVRRVSPAGTITTVAGNGSGGKTGDGAAATAASLNSPTDVAVQPGGGFYIVGYDSHAVRRVDSAGVISTFAGTGQQGYDGDGGPATSAKLKNPRGLALDSAGSLFISEFGNDVVRKVTPDGTISTVAGTGVQGYSGDGGPATSAELRDPARVVTDREGNLFLSDLWNHRVRRVETAAAPGAPTVDATEPASPANDNQPRIVGTSPAGTTVTIHTDAACTTPAVASGSAAEFASPGIAVTVSDDTEVTFWARAIGAGGLASGCSTTSLQYEEDSTPPSAPAITSSPPDGADRSPQWEFTTEPGTSSACWLVGPTGAVVAPVAPCSSPVSYDLTGEPTGTYTFGVSASDTAGNTATTASSYELSDPPPPEPQPDPEPEPEVTPPAPPPAPPPPDPEPEPTPEPEPEPTPVQPDPAPAPPPVDAPPAPDGGTTLPVPAAAPPGAPAEAVPSPRTSSPAAPTTSSVPSTVPAPRTVSDGPVSPAPRPSRSAPEPRRTPPAVAPGPQPLAVRAREVVAAVVHKVATAAVAVSEETAFPGALTVVMVAFLGVQDRIDRSDPKLALAPVRADPELSFEPPDTAGGQFT